jgi:ABC-type sugar transport system ATPase subunit
MAAIILDGVEKVYDAGRAAVRDLNLHVRDGELVVLVGPSGSGKSTTLRLVAGLESASRGRILIGDRDVTRVPPQQRDVAMVFQSYALYPHKSVRDNLAFPLTLRGLSRTAIAERVQRAVDTLQIGELLDRRPSQLSGGERQRVALGRALVREPQAFLLDEPLSNLDAFLRLEMRTAIARLHQRLRATMLYVTHDQEEAMKLGERLVVMRDGRIEQIGSPMDVYAQPASIFVARFVGLPPMNLLVRPPAGVQVPAGAVIGIRPQDLCLVAADEASADVVAGVDLVEPVGPEQHVHLLLDGHQQGGTDDGRAVAVIGPQVPLTVGQRVGVQFKRDRMLVFDRASGRRVR